MPLLFFGAPERSRTPNLQIRSLTLCPIELQAHAFYGGERGIRTLAPLSRLLLSRQAL